MLRSGMKSADVFRVGDIIVDEKAFEKVYHADLYVRFKGRYYQVNGCAFNWNKKGSITGMILISDEMERGLEKWSHKL
jgi:hypothetical protein